MVDTERTKQFYIGLKPDDICDCNYCKNYCFQVKKEYPEVATYLSSFGVDIEKPYETSPLEPDEDCILEYCCCQYIVFGNCPDTYNHRIGDVSFRIASSYPSTGIKEPHFIIEFNSIKLKMMLPL